MGRAAPLSLRQLPKEVRQLIYEQNHELAMRLDNSIPNLLLALAPDQQLFEEAQALYRTQNFSLSSPTANTPQELAFKAKPVSELLCIRHLRLVFQATSDEGILKNGPLYLRGHEILLTNNLESLTVVIEKRGDDVDATAAAWRLMNASRPGVRRVVLRIEERDNEMMDKEYIDFFCKKMGVLVAATDGRDGRVREEIWIWEADSGTVFKRFWPRSAEKSISGNRVQEPVPC